MLNSGDKNPSEVISDLLGKGSPTLMSKKLKDQHSSSNNTLQYTLEAFILTHTEYLRLFSKEAMVNSILRLEGTEYTAS